MLTANQQQMAQVWPFLNRHRLQPAGVAAVEPHLRRQPQLQHGAGPRRRDPRRRRPARARPDREDGEEPARGETQLLLQCAARLRHAAALPGTGRGHSRATCSSACEGVFYAGAALPQSVWERLEGVARRVRRRRAAGVVHLVVGCHRNVAGDHQRALAHRSRRLHRCAAARHRAEVGAQRRQARDAGARAHRVPRLPRCPRAHRAAPSTRTATT